MTALEQASTGFVTVARTGDVAPGTGLPRHLVEAA